MTRIGAGLSEPKVPGVETRTTQACLAEASRWAAVLDECGQVLRELREVQETNAAAQKSPGAEPKENNAPMYHCVWEFSSFQRQMI